MSDLSQQLLRSHRLPANTDFLPDFLAAAVDVNTKNNSDCLLAMMLLTQAQFGLEIVGFGGGNFIICCLNLAEKRDYRKTAWKMSGNKQGHEGPIQSGFAPVSASTQK